MSTMGKGLALFRARLERYEPSARGRELARILREIVKAHDDPEGAHKLADAALLAFCSVGGDSSSEAATIYLAITRWYS